MEKKVKQALALIRSASQRHGLLEVAYSGGKDSDVILELVKMAGVPYVAIHKNTTIDPPGTLAYVRKKGVEIRNPQKGFFKLIEEKGYSRRGRRICCDNLKEYPTENFAVVEGIRKEESTRRKKMYSEPIMCRTGGGVAILPILEWTLADLAEFIRLYKIELHPLYRTDNGYDLKRRLGCLGCPLVYYKQRLREFVKYPRLVEKIIKSGQIYMDAHPHSTITEKFKDAKEWFAIDLFCRDISYEDALKYKAECVAVIDLILNGELTEEEINNKKFLKKYVRKF